MKYAACSVRDWLLTGLLATAVPLSLAAESPAAAAPGAGSTVTRTVLRRQDLDIPGREMVMLAVVLPAGVAEDLHTHPADLFAFVEQGDLTLEVEGMPTATYHSGETFHVPGGKKHRGINRGPVTVRLATVQAAYKGQPLTVPAPTSPASPTPPVR